MSAADDTATQRYYLLTYPRTTSNLLVKILALDAQTNITCGQYDAGYFFLSIDDTQLEPRLRTRPVGNWTIDERIEVRDGFQATFVNMQAWIESVESQGRSVFVKEHIVHLADPTERTRLQFDLDTAPELPWTVDYAGGSTHSDLNNTVLPDEFLLTWLPTFLIRHPALAFPSLYRTIIKREGSEAAAADNYASLLITVTWTRALYDFFVQRREQLPCSAEESVQWPIVIDADDVLAHPETVSLYCQKLHLDPAQLRFNWDEVAQEELSEIDADRKLMRSTLFQSTGIISGKTSRDLNVNDEVEKWKKEFGIPAADHLGKLVRGAMPDYEYLRERRLRADADMN